MLGPGAINNQNNSNISNNLQEQSYIPTIG